jgi:hypothetical protein
MALGPPAGAAGRGGNRSPFRYQESIGGDAACQGRLRILTATSVLLGSRRLHGSTKKAAHLSIATFAELQDLQVLHFSNITSRPPNLAPN